MYWTVHLSDGPRNVNHAAVAIGTSIFTFGCQRFNFYTPKPIDIHVFDTVKLKWWKLELVKDQDYQCVPPQRYSHTVVAQDSLIYLWGGRNFEEVGSTIYCFDTKTLKWSTPNVCGDIPLPTSGHSACIIKNSMYIFGGYHNSTHQISQDLYMLNLHTMKWSLVMTEGIVPCPRNFHTATAIGNRMYIFGGYGIRSEPMQIYQEIYCTEIYYFDTETKMWMCPIVFGSRPLGRHGHSAFVHNGFLHIFGGFNKLVNFYSPIISRYDPKSSSWITITPKGTSPYARKSQICQVVNDRVFISGGTSSVNTLTLMPMNLLDYGLIELMVQPLNDLHVLDLNPNLVKVCLVKLWEFINEKKICGKNLCIPLSLKNDLAAIGPFEEMDAEIN